MMNNYGYYPNYNYFQPQAPQVPQVQQFQPPTPIQPTIQDERIWVASESAAEAYPVTANGFVRLWDSNNPIFYEKRADASGRPFPLVKYEYKVSTHTVAEPTTSPITADIEKRLSDIEEEITRLKKGKKPVNAKEVTENE